MTQTTFGQLTTFGALGDLRFPVFRMTLTEMMGAVLKMVSSANTTLSRLTSSASDPLYANIALKDTDLSAIANEVLAHDISDLDSDTTVYNLDNLVRASLLNATTNNHNSSGDTLTTLKTDGTTKTVFTKTTNKRGEATSIGHDDE